MGGKQHIDAVARLHHLQPFPATAVRLIEVAAADEVDLDEVTAVIKQDPALAASLLA